MTEEEILTKLKQYHFNSIIPLTDKISTPGTPFQNEIISMLALHSIDVKNKRVLDIGCRDGKFSFEAEKRGASEVIGIDNDLSPAAIEFLIPFFKSNVKIYEMNLMDLTAEKFGRFDVILFFGVLYHLRYPFYALKIIRNVMNPGGILLIETACLRDSNKHALLYCPTGADSPYEDTSCTFFNQKGICDTLQSLGFYVDAVEHLEDHVSIPSGSISHSLLHYLSLFLKPRRLLRGSSLFIRRIAMIIWPRRQCNMLVNRSTFRCTLTNEGIDPSVINYWDGLHNLETPSKREQPWVPTKMRR